MVYSVLVTTFHLTCIMSGFQTRIPRYIGGTDYINVSRYSNKNIKTPKESSGTWWSVLNMPQIPKVGTITLIKDTKNTHPSQKFYGLVQVHVYVGCGSCSNLRLNKSAWYSLSIMPRLSWGCIIIYLGIRKISALRWYLYYYFSFVANIYINKVINNTINIFYIIVHVARDYIAADVPRGHVVRFM